jgi:hypothetical protein
LLACVQNQPDGKEARTKYFRDAWRGKTTGEVPVIGQLCTYDCAGCVAHICMQSLDPNGKALQRPVANVLPIHMLRRSKAGAGCLCKFEKMFKATETNDRIRGSALNHEKISGNVCRLSRISARWIVKSLRGPRGSRCLLLNEKWLRWAHQAWHCICVADVSTDPQVLSVSFVCIVSTFKRHLRTGNHSTKPVACGGVNTAQ